MPDSFDVFERDMLNTSHSSQQKDAEPPTAQAKSFFEKGWCRFARDPQIAAWAAHALPHAIATTTAPENASWLRCGGTWFAGVNALDNDETGRVAGGDLPLAGAAIDFVADTLGLTAPRDFHWDRGQASICYPGYPKPMDGESPAAFQYRRNRDAAHLDGVHPVGSAKRRHLMEPHAFVLGIPLTTTSADASPLVVWEGSHELIRTALLARYDGIPPDSWADEDVTEAYQKVRREVFENCPRVVVHAVPGESYLIHRLTIHGVSPWADGAAAPDEGRVIAYFRPEATAAALSGNAAWLNAP